MMAENLLTVTDIERAARACLSNQTAAYVAGGAGLERSVKMNTAAFDTLYLRPRILSCTDKEPNTQIAVFGTEVSIPILLAPTSPQRLLHEDAELATASAAARSGTVCIVSTDSHFGYPEIASKAEGKSWFQLYPYRSRAVVEASLDMAISAGATAIVLTVDAFYPARRLSAKRIPFHIPDFVKFGTLELLGVASGVVPVEGRMERIPLSWDDLAWIRARTRVPLIVKGILHPSDARQCANLGVDGVIVSNHGGRQLDCALPSIMALDAISTEVGRHCTVLFDGGVRSGVDVVKAIALGAHAVCIGRPYLWGLGLGGTAGVTAVLDILRTELEDTLRQIGVCSLTELTDNRAHVLWASNSLTTHHHLHEGVSNEAYC